MSLQMIAQRYLSFFVCLYMALVFLPETAFAQRDQRFTGAIVAGLTASQIDGDQSAGFHKVGVQSGLRVATKLKGRQSASLELLYTQRGCKNEPQIEPFFSTTLHYVEAPVTWHINDWLIEGKGRERDYYRVQLNGGLIYGRLINAKDRYDEAGIIVAIPYLRQNSLSFTLGASYYFSRHLGLNIRWQRALTALYKPGDGGNFQNTLIERYLTFQLHYVL